MKRLISVLLAALIVFSLASCGEEEKKESKPKKAKDWRNSIAYEGSFFVNEHTKILYALDTGTVTLWDNGGDGQVLQTLKYDTAVPDAMSKVETADFNNDSNTDIRIIYSDNNSNRTYNLWLWDTEAGNFSFCSLYRTIINPVYNEEDNTVSGTADMGVFGTLNKVFAFDDAGALTKISADVTDAEDVAGAISEKFSKGTVKRGDGTATVEDAECRVFIVSDGETDICYIAYDEDANWYIDIGCINIYRSVYEEGGDFALGEFCGEAKNAIKIVQEYSGFDDAVLKGRSIGKLLGYDAEKFTLSADGGNSIYKVIITSKNVWYLEDDSDVCYPVYASAKTLGDAVDSKFGN